MWSVEELSIQHQAQKITVLNVKKNSAPTGRTDGLGLLYMGYQSIFLGKRFQKAISSDSSHKSLDDEVDDDPPDISIQSQTSYGNDNLHCAPELQTLLDTGQIKLVKAPCSSTVSDHQVQTDLSMPFWVLNNIGQSLLSPQIDLPLCDVETEEKKCESGDSSLLTSQNNQLLKSGRSQPIDLNACQQFSVVHYENLDSSKGKSMVMVQTQEKEQRSVRMFDVNQQRSTEQGGPNLNLNESSIHCQRTSSSKSCEEKNQLDLPLSSSHKYKSKELPSSNYNKYGYTSQYQPLNDRDISPCSTISTSSYHTSPDITNELSSPADDTTSSSLGVSSASSDNSPMHTKNKSNVAPSYSIGSDMVSLLSTPTDELIGGVSSEGESSIWDSIQCNKSGNVAPEDYPSTDSVTINESDSTTLVADVEELNPESLHIPLKSVGDKPAISYKAYKVDVESSEVVLSKAKIATYLPLMQASQRAIEGDFSGDDDDDVDDVQYVVSDEENISEDRYLSQQLPVIQEYVNGSEVQEIDQIGTNDDNDKNRATDNMEHAINNQNNRVLLNEKNSHELKENTYGTKLNKPNTNDSFVRDQNDVENINSRMISVKLRSGDKIIDEFSENGMDNREDKNKTFPGTEVSGDNSIESDIVNEHRHSLDGTVHSMESISDMSVQTYSGETQTDQQSNTGDETDLYYDAENYTPRKQATESLVSRSVKQQNGQHSLNESAESLTIYIKNKLKTPGQSLSGSSSSAHRSKDTAMNSTPDKAKHLKKEGIMTKSFPVGKRPVTVGLNQLQSVVSRSHQKSNLQQGIGLNQLSSTSPKLKRKPHLHVSLLSPGGSTTSEDEGSPFKKGGSRLSGESDTSPGAYLMASYDDGSDWGDDSLLWNTDSVESLNSYTSDCNYEVVMDCEVHANWMSELPERIHDIPLNGLVIPGSHISFAIERDLRPDMDISKCNYEMAEFLRKLPNLSIFNCFRSMIKKIWKSWMGKQMLSVSQQLYAGVRYLDLRITKYRSALYAEHGLYSQQLPKYLKEIKLFADTHAKEVIILHFGALNQIDKKDKRRLVTMLFQIFGSKLAKSPNDLTEVTLNFLWKKKKQVIIVFPEEDVALLHNHIFAGLIWPENYVITRQCNAHLVPELLHFLDDVYYKDLSIAQSKRNQFHVTRAVLSPDMSLVFGEYQFNGVRDMTLEDTHPAVYKWLEEKSNLNIVALDFVGRGDIIEQIICLNYSKYSIQTTV